MSEAAQAQEVKQSWGEILALFFQRRVLTMFFFGFSSGIPLLLIFSSLGLWLREAGLERSAVTYFSWAALAYSFKFVWAPLVDRLPVPFLTRLLGRRRSWILTAQLAVILALIVMGSNDPATGHNALVFLALSTVMLGFSSATQDIVVDAYRIESADSDLQAMLSAAYIGGYRVAMIVSGAGALYLAEIFGSSKEHYLYSAWRWTYFAMAAVMLIGVLTTLFSKEPGSSRPNEIKKSTAEHLRFLLLFLLATTGFVLAFFHTGETVEIIKQSMVSHFINDTLAGFLAQSVRLLIGIAAAAVVAFISIKLGLVEYQTVDEAYVAPVRSFFQQYGTRLAWLLLTLIGTYRISDIVLGVIANIFYQDMGFTKIEIAKIAKTFGLFMTLAGGFVGGVLSIRYGVMRILYMGAILTVVTNLLFVLLAKGDANTTMLYAVIAADNLTAGLASAAFVAFLSSLTNVSFTAVQYAIFSSLMTLFPKVLGGYSGSMVDSIGYVNFFIYASMLGVPVLLLLWLTSRKLKSIES